MEVYGLDGEKQKNGGSRFKNRPCWGSDSLKRLPPLFLLPSFEDVIQCQIEGRFQALLHDTHDFGFENGFLFLFWELSPLLYISLSR